MATKQTTQAAPKPEAAKPLRFVGDSEEARRIQSLVYDRLSSIMERFGQSLTTTEARTLQYVMSERIVEDDSDGEPSE
jgi:hypothetical protein